MVAKTHSDQRDLFLCHSKKDAAWVGDLAARVEAEEWNGRRLRVAFDEWDVGGGENVIRRLGELLESSRHVAVVLSPEMLDSEWAEMEWTSAVYDDPAGRRQRVLPLLLREYSEDGTRRLNLPVPLRHLNRFDFRRKTSFAREFARLLAVLRNEPTPRARRGARGAAQGTRLPAVLAPVLGPQAAPDTTPESLVSNLLPVLSAPTTIWGAATSIRRPAEVWERLHKADHNAIPPFLLRDGNLYSFAELDPSSNPLGKVVTGHDAGSVPLAAWRTDPSRSRWLIELFNVALNRQLRTVSSLRFDKETGRHFFIPTYDGSTRLPRKRRFKGSTRTVAKPCNRADGSLYFWIHHGCRMRFQYLGQALYLRLIPCWVITEDGFRPRRGLDVGPLTVKWAARERNAAILRNVLFWAHVLADGRSGAALHTGAAPIALPLVPDWSEIQAGVAGDQIRVRALLRDRHDELDRAASVVMAKEGLADAIDTTE